MNATELAEDLEGAKLVILRLNEMLRQKQAEIEVLTKFLNETCQIGKFIVWNSTDKAQKK